MYKVEEFGYTLTTPIPIGRQGETGATTIQIDVSKLVEGYSGYSIVLAEQRSQDKTAFNIESSLSGNTLTWNVTEYDTFYDGHGRIEVRLVKDGVIVKSAIAYTFCEKSLTGNEGAPSPSPSWYNQLIVRVGAVETEVVVIDGEIDDINQKDGEQDTAIATKAEKNGYYSTLGAGTAENLIDTKAMPTQQVWSGLRTSCGDVSISDDGTARINAIYGNTVDGKNMTVDMIETVGFNLFAKTDYTGETQDYDGRECIKYGSGTLQKMLTDKPYIGLGQIEVGMYVHRNANYAPRVRFEYSDGTAEDVSAWNGNGTASAWGQFYFLSDPDKIITAIYLKHGGTSSTNPQYADISTICIHYVWSGYRNGEFEEHWKRVLELPISTYFPDGMMSVGSVRDELRADKAIQRCELVGGVVTALAEPIETPIEPALNFTYTVSDFGTENAKSTGESSPFIADIAYNSDFPRMVVNNSEHIGTMNELQTDAKSNLVSAINEIVARLTALEGGV